jgi:N-acetylmuramoyl-L-alanine amidase
MKKILLSVFLIIIFIISPTYAYLIKGSETEIDAIDVTIDGRRYILLTDVCNANGIEWRWDSISRKIILQRDAHEVILLLESKYYYVDRKIKKLNAPIRMKNGLIYVPLRFSKYTIRHLFDLDKKISKSAPRVISEKRPGGTKKSPPAKFRIKKVIIDPGHGGKDPGAISRTGLKEKHIVLDVSKRIKAELEKKDIDVIMTRNSDKFIPLGERARIANKNCADLFISIHANASRSRWLRGFEAYYLSEATDDNARALEASENSVLKYEESSFARHTKNLDAIVWDLKFTEHREESIELAGFICQEVGKRLKLRRNKVRSAGFYVLKGTEMPAVLVELSYLSNRWDEKNLRKSDYKQKLSEGIVMGIIGFKNEYERTNGFSQ